MNNDNEIYMPNEVFEPQRERVVIKIDSFVQHTDKIFRIAQILDFESIIGVDVISGRSVLLRIGELRPVSDEKDEPPSLNTDLYDIADKDWVIAETRFAAIKPLINKLVVGRDEAEFRANEIGIDTATLYRWLRRYKAYGVVSALVPQKRGWAKGNNRISSDAEEVIQDVIKDFYLQPQRPTAQKTIIEVQRICYLKTIDPPSPFTIRDRISKIAEKPLLRGRGYKEKAKNKFTPAAGTFPNADFPLSVIQIDHTPVDIILVDDEYRKPIGRPWITVAIDVYSRMVTGYYLSFDAPSETSVAMCVAHSVIPKDEWLLLHKVDTQWPVWGLPMTIHVDNGPDFRSNAFQKACVTYGINVEYRPVKQPQYGGHIERLLGTFLKEIHALPGTTFSSIKNREGYDSDKHAAMTKSEFEEWLIVLMCKLYHQKLHSKIGMSPFRKWEIGVFGNAETQGVGMPPRPADRLTLLLDFLPYYNRTVQAFGVTIDGMTYYAEALRPWINFKEQNTGEKKKFIFRRDPRDISTIWFFDPTLKLYFKIPFANLSLPAMSIWELKQAKDKLKREGASKINENLIMQAIIELRDRVEESKSKTKKARRQAQRRKDHEKNISPVSPFPEQNKPTKPLSASFSDLTDEDFDFDGDIE